MKYNRDIQSGLYLPNHYRRSSPFDRIHLQWFAETGGWFVIDGEDAGSPPNWEWDSISEAGSNDFSLQATAKNNGSNGYLCDLPSGDSYTCYAVKAFASAKAELYLRFCMLLSADYTFVSSGNTSTIFRLWDGSTTLIDFRIQRDGAGGGAPDRWLMNGGQGLGWDGFNTNFSVNVWHRLEFHWLAGSGADGGAQIWIDGDSVFSDLDNDLTTYSADDFYLGTGIDGAGSSDNTGHIYFDDIKADDSPIGVYSDAGGGSIIPFLLHQQRRRRCF